MVREGREGGGGNGKKNWLKETSWQEKKLQEGNLHTPTNHVKDVVNGHADTKQQRTTSTEGAISC